MRSDEVQIGYDGVIVRAGKTLPGATIIRHHTHAREASTSEQDACSRQDVQHQHKK